MTPYRFRLKPCSAFGTCPLGDTLFGQLCWAIRNRYGEYRLIELLEAYTENHPFCIISDAMPSGYLPRPVLPSSFYQLEGQERKQIKKRVWLPWEQFDRPLCEWVQHSLASKDIPGCIPETHVQPHNTLNRETGTTGTGEFAPYTMDQLWYGLKASLDVIVMIDHSRFSLSECGLALDDMGQTGFGRDASIGLGKFTLENNQPDSIVLPVQSEANAWLTLAPTAPQGGGFNPEHSFYQPFTRFGRHGDQAVHLPGGPFKTPLLMAYSGAVFTPNHFQPRFYVGKGLGGDGSLSKTLPSTVQQAYAPVLGINLPIRENSV